MKSTNTGYVNHESKLESHTLFESDSGNTYIQYHGYTYRVIYNELLNVWDPVELILNQFSLD